MIELTEKQKEYAKLIPEYISIDASSSVEGDETKGWNGS